MSSLEIPTTAALDLSAEKCYDIGNRIIRFPFFIPRRRPQGSAMTDKEAVFHILAGIMSADGEIVPEEGLVMRDYVADETGGLDFDPLAVLRKLRGTDRAGRIALFSEAVHRFKDRDEGFKYDILDRVVDMIVADKRVHKSEGVVFDIIRHAWGMDIKSALRKKGISI